jgi:hypothetical protein
MNVTPVSMIIPPVIVSADESFASAERSPVALIHPGERMPP